MSIGCSSLPSRSSSFLLLRSLNACTRSSAGACCSSEILLFLGVIVGGAAEAQR
jgi:hypothetical protein